MWGCWGGWGSNLIDEDDLHRWLGNKNNWENYCYLYAICGGKLEIATHSGDEEWKVFESCGKRKGKLHKDCGIERWAIFECQSDITNFRWMQIVL